jgi:hypothetical protein
MRAVAWCGCVFFLLVLACLWLPGTVADQKTPRRCPRTHAEAKMRGTVSYGGKCYEVFTCTEACEKSLRKLAESSEEAFADKYQVEHATENGEAGVHLSHHINRQRAQFAVEIPCAYS